MTKHRTQNVTKLKNLKFGKTQKLKMWQNLKTQNVAKLKNSKCEEEKNSKTQNVTKF